MVGPASAGDGRWRHDSDGDGMPDMWDANRDGLRNLAEYLRGTGVQAPDTDDDGLIDGDEVHRFRTGPRKIDSDRNGIDDGLDDGTGNGIPDEAEDGDREGFAGTIMGLWEDGRRLQFESALGSPVTIALNRDTIVRTFNGCPADRASLLVEGNDIATIRLTGTKALGLPLAGLVLVRCVVA
jgi:hypothetical protein